MCMATGYAKSPFDYFYQDCGFSQKDVYNCMSSKIDSDHDGGITRDELSTALQQSSNYLLKAINYIGGVSVVFKNCDYDKNGEITTRDMKMASDVCFKNPFHRCLMKKVCNKI